MPGSIFNESFEGAGYENSGWTEDVGAGCTVDEDSTLTPPTGGGSQVLRLVSATSGFYARNGNLIADLPTCVYSSFFFKVISEGMADGAEAELFFAASGAPDWKDLFHLYIHDIAGVLYLRLDCLYDGSSHSFTSDSAIALNTWYQVDIKWDIPNHAWEWRLGDGTTQVTQDNGTLSGTHGLSFRNFYFGDRWNAQTWETLVDLVWLDATAYRTAGGTSYNEGITLSSNPACSYSPQTDLLGSLTFASTPAAVMDALANLYASLGIVSGPTFAAVGGSDFYEALGLSSNPALLTSLYADFFAGLALGSSPALSVSALADLIGGIVAASSPIWSAVGGFDLVEAIILASAGALALQAEWTSGPKISIGMKRTPAGLSSCAPAGLKRVAGSGLRRDA